MKVNTELDDTVEQVQSLQRQLNRQDEELKANEREIGQLRQSRKR